MIDIDQYRLGNVFIDELARKLDDNMAEILLMSMTNWRLDGGLPDRVGELVVYDINVPSTERLIGMPVQPSGRKMLLKFGVDHLILCFKYEFKDGVTYGTIYDFNDPRFNVDRIAKIVNSFYWSRNAGRLKYMLLDMKEFGWIRTSPEGGFSSHIREDKWF